MSEGKYDSMVNEALRTVSQIDAFERSRRRFAEDEIPKTALQALQQQAITESPIRKIDQLAKQARRDLNHGRPTEALKQLDEIIRMLKS